MDVSSWLSIILRLLLILVILQVVFVIISENRNPYKTISWLLVLTFLPIIGLILYFHFGEEHRKKHKLIKKLYKGIERGYSPSFQTEDTIIYPQEYDKLIYMLKNISDTPLLDGNQVDFYIDGEAKFRQFFLDIENARDHVHILYYKVQDDNLGRRFQELLIRKAKEGVAVRLLYDDVGSLKTKQKYFSKMKEQGIEVEAFLPVKIPRIARSVNYRNHRKLAVIDGKIGYVGGMNIADCYVEGVSWGVWRDMQIRIVGNGVKGLQKVFLLDWYSTRKILPQSTHFFPELNRIGNNPMQIVSSGPIDFYNSIEKGIYQAINGARKNIYIQTPYFIPSEAVLSALLSASVSGVDVHVMIPRRSDNFFVDGATYSFVRDMLNYDIKVYLYNGGFIHTKCLVIDNSLTIVGSANMDNRSFELSFETDAFIYDEASAQKAKDIFLNDALDSFLIKKEEWKKRPRLRRFFESIMRIFTPLL